MPLIKRIIKPVLFSLLLMLSGTGFAVAAEVDDAAIFVEAFAAYQSRDYLLAAEKADLLTQVFPDSPLRDVTLLLLARSHMKSGDAERAAKTIAVFSREFSQSNLMTTVENELRALELRLQKGEPLPPDTQMQAAARKIRAERIEQERIAAQKREMERSAREKIEREQLVRLRLAAEQRERERLQAEKAAKESIKMAVTVKAGGTAIAVGNSGTIPFELSNRGKKSEEFLLEVASAPEYGAAITPLVDKNGPAALKVFLKAGEVHRSSVTLRMPDDKVDGQRVPFTVKAISAKFHDVAQTTGGLAIASAPLVRVVAKLGKAKVLPGEQLTYRLTLLNIGSMTAQDMTVRLLLPAQIDFLSADSVKFNQEQNGTFVFRVARLETGRTAEIILDVKVRENSTAGQELRGQIEVINGLLQRKDIFTGSASLVQAR